MNTLPCKERRSKDYCAIKHADSEGRADLELEGLFLVAFFLADGAAKRQLQRAERGFPRQTDTSRVFPAARIGHVPVHTGITRATPSGCDLTGVGEQEPTQRAVARSARDRNEELGVGHQAARAAQVIVGVDVARTERATFVAAHGTNAPGIDVLEDREGLAAVGLAPIAHEVE